MVIGMVSALVGFFVGSLFKIPPTANLLISFLILSLLILVV